MAMANVMVNDLLARSRFGVVPWMVLLAAAYGFTLPAMLSTTLLMPVIWLTMRGIHRRSIAS